MITITNSAAEQIKPSLNSDDDKTLRLRIAAKKTEDGSLDYAMGVVIDIDDEDIMLEINGIPVVVEKTNQSLMEEMVIDYVELKEGEEKSFIFLNPNDPNYVPPSEGDLENIPTRNRNQ